MHIVLERDSIGKPVAVPGGFLRFLETGRNSDQMVNTERAASRSSNCEQNSL